MQRPLTSGPHPSSVTEHSPRGDTAGGQLQTRSLVGIIELVRVATQARRSPSSASNMVSLAWARPPSRSADIAAAAQLRSVVQSAADATRPPVVAEQNRTTASLPG